MSLITYTFDKVRGETLEQRDGWEEQLAMIMFMKKKRICWIRMNGEIEPRMFQLHLTVKEITE